MSLFSLGIVLYHVEVAITLWLLVTLVRRREYVNYPAFTLFIAFCTLSHVVLLPLYVTANYKTYTLLWEISEALGSLLLVTVCAEIIAEAYKWKNAVAAITPLGVFPALLLVTQFSYNASRIADCAIACMAVLTLPKVKSMDGRSLAIAGGVFVACFFPSLIKYPTEVVAQPLLAFVPTMSFVLALGVWMKPFRERGVYMICE